MCSSDLTALAISVIPILSDDNNGTITFAFVNDGKAPPTATMEVLPSNALAYPFSKVNSGRK